MYRGCHLPHTALLRAEQHECGFPQEAMSLAPCSSGANEKPCGVGGPEKMAAKKRVYQEKHRGRDGALPLGLQATSKSELTLKRDSCRTWVPVGGTPACPPSGGSRGERAAPQARRPPLSACSEPQTRLPPISFVSPRDCCGL